MGLARHPRLLIVLTSVGVVVLLRVLTYGNGGGGGLQLVQQLLMPVPVLVGAWATAARLRQARAWAVPMLVFLAALPLVYTALEERTPDEDGSVYCGAWGFLPALPDWEDAMWLRVAYPVVGLLAVLAGLALLPSATWRWLGLWLVVAGTVLGVTVFAAPVCVGA